MSATVLRVVTELWVPGPDPLDHVPDWTEPDVEWELGWGWLQADPELPLAAALAAWGRQLPPAYRRAAEPSLADWVLAGGLAVECRTDGSAALLRPDPHKPGHFRRVPLGGATCGHAARAGLLEKVDDLPL